MIEYEVAAPLILENLDCPDFVAERSPQSAAELYAANLYTEGFNAKGDFADGESILINVRVGSENPWEVFSVSAVLSIKYSARRESGGGS